MEQEKKDVSCDCNAYLPVIGADGGGLSLKVDLSKGDTLSDLNGLFMDTNTRGMLEGKLDCRLDMVVNFVTGLIYRATGPVEYGLMTRLHTEH